MDMTVLLSPHSQYSILCMRQIKLSLGKRVAENSAAELRLNQDLYDPSHSCHSEPGMGMGTF